jgi:hypothetical protein
LSPDLRSGSDKGLTAEELKTLRIPAEIAVDFGAAVYRKSTGASGLGKSAAKNYMLEKGIFWVVDLRAKLRPVLRPDLDVLFLAPNPPA